MKTIFFPGLNGVRTIAVSLVLFQHIEAFKHKIGGKSLFDISFFNSMINEIGHHGVLIFFVLSGFLISYLLFCEKEATNTIVISKFYIRRILRIWPLYFFILIVGFFILPHVFSPSYFDVKTTPDFFKKLLECILFVPNYVFFNYGHIFSIGILWSIGAEEQFYLIWPNLIKKISTKNTVSIIAAVLVVLVISKAFIYYTFLNNAAIENKTGFIAYHFLEYDAMVIGGLMAFIYHQYKEKINFLYNKYLQFFYYYY